MFKRILLAIVVLAQPGWAQYERPGSADAQFLKIDGSARAAGMGSAYIAVVRDAEGVQYNPAALARIQGTSVAFTHTMWFADISHEFAAIAHSFGRGGAAGVSVTALNTDEMEVRTPLKPDGTGETFYAGNYRFGLSYARFLTDHVSFGGTLNYVTLSLYDDFSVSTFAADVAILYTTSMRDFCFAMKFSNFGSSIQFVNETYPLPTDFTFGLSANVIEQNSQQLLTSMSAVKPNDGKPLGQVGMEWSYRDLLFLRSGYRLNHGVARFSFGGGLRTAFSQFGFRLDYAYSDFSQLGAAHRFSLGLSY